MHEHMCEQIFVIVLITHFRVSFCYWKSRQEEITEVFGLFCFFNQFDPYILACFSHLCPTLPQRYQDQKSYPLTPLGTRQEKKGRALVILCVCVCVCVCEREREREREREGNKGRKEEKDRHWKEFLLTSEFRAFKINLKLLFF